MSGERLTELTAIHSCFSVLSHDLHSLVPLCGATLNGNFFAFQCTPTFKLK